MEYLNTFNILHVGLEWLMSHKIVDKDKTKQRVYPSIILCCRFSDLIHEHNESWVPKGMKTFIGFQFWTMVKYVQD